MKDTLKSAEFRKNKKELINKVKRPKGSEDIKVIGGGYGGEMREIYSVFVAGDKFRGNGNKGPLKCIIILQESSLYSAYLVLEVKWCLHNRHGPVTLLHNPPYTKVLSKDLEKVGSLSLKPKCTIESRAKDIIINLIRTLVKIMLAKHPRSDMLLMEILLEPTSNKLMVEHVEYNESNTYVLERLNTTVGNPVKEIILKLNLPDHRILKDGGEGLVFLQTCLAEIRGFLKKFKEGFKEGMKNEEG
ncbi:hypothetical protein Tco_0716694 [Tanacetum coccineum]